MAININIPSQFLDYNNLAAFPATGSAKILYVAKDTNKLYRWDGSAYVEVSASQASSWGSITGNLASQVDLQGELDNKVNTESGKGLSTNDYTTTEKNKLAGIASGAEVNVNADWNASSGDAQILNKPTIPSIAGLATTSYVDSQDATKQDVLVSGTNIKTINGTTVLGSGDITISGGSGVTDVTATAPLASSGGTTPDISIPQANVATDGYLSLIDYQYFSTKQEELVSGTNIKTINSTSLLGSGNVAVQPTLVSGTNIKTINGSSVLGSGNLTISGGGGLQGLHNVNGYFDLTSQGISAQLNASGTIAVIINANQMYAYPFIPNNTITSVSLKINVTTLGAGVNCRILIYSSVSGVPTTKVYESANLDCSTTGVKTATTSFTFTAGTTYWLCVQSSGTTSLSGIQPSALIPLAMATSPASAPTVAYINTSTFGSAPTTFAINNRTNAAAPLVGIYLS